MVQFETVLRIRPLSKKERDDPIILEPSLGGGGAVVGGAGVIVPSKESGDVVVTLHPPPPIDEDAASMMSPSSSLIRQTICPDNVQPTHDVDFSMDHVFTSEADQDKMYSFLGHPKARLAIEPLKYDPKKFHVERTNHLIIAMGSSGSGKTYTCWGGQTIHPKRREGCDGLIPRILNCLFSQAEHHLTIKKGYSFAVKINISQVNQSKKNSDECEIHHILQIPPPRAFSITSTTTSTLSMLSTSRNPSVNSAGHIDTQKKVIVERDYHQSSSSSASDTGCQEELCGEPKICHSLEEAREALQIAMKNSARVSNSKKYSNHVLVSIQPLLMEAKSPVISRKGGIVSILDMAGCDHNNNLKTRCQRVKDVAPNRDDAHAAVLHCLKTLQQNDEVTRNGSATDSKGQQKENKTKTTKVFTGYDEDDENDDDGDDENSSSSNKFRGNVTSKLRRRQSLKKVPYRQHKLTMLMQPIFTSKDVEDIHVTIVVAAYPGHRDYVDKLSLFNDIKTFRRSATLGVLLPASTGDAVKVTPLASSSPRKKKEKDRCSSSKSSKKKKKDKKNIKETASVPGAPPAAYDADKEEFTNKKSHRKQAPYEADSEASQKKSHHRKRLHHHDSNVPPTAPGLAYDDFVPMEPMPPPVAPSYFSRFRSTFVSPILAPPPAPSAPPLLERDYHGQHPCAMEHHQYNGSQQYQHHGPAVPDTVISFPSSEESAVSPPPNGQVPFCDSLHHEHRSLDPLSSIGVNKFFNKVVSASKKTGKHVMEKLPIPITSSYGHGSSSSSVSEAKGQQEQHSSIDIATANLKERIEKLEQEKQGLLKQNETLQEENVTLKNENERLRAVAATHNSTSSSNRKEEREEVDDVTYCQADEREEDDWSPSRRESYLSQQSKDTMKSDEGGNQIGNHLSKLLAPSPTSRTKKSTSINDESYGSISSPCPSRSTSKSVDRCRSRLLGDSNRNTSSFADPLFAHMATLRRNENKNSNPWSNPSSSIPLNYPSNFNRAGTLDKRDRDFSK